MGKIFKFGWGKVRTEVGAVAVEATIALPLFVTLLFLFQDLLVVGYNFIGIRHTLEEGIRVAAMGPACRLGDPPCSESELQAHLSAAREKLRSVGTNVGVWDGWGFMNNETDLYDGDLNIETLQEEDAMGGDDNDCRQSAFDYPDPNGVINVTRFCRVHIKLSKNIKLTPPSGLLLTLAGGDGSVTITREDWAAVER